MKLDLERQKGQPISYNDLIKDLLEKHLSEKKKSQALEKFKELKGILPKGTLKEFLLEREIDRKSEETKLEQMVEDQE